MRHHEISSPVGKQHDNYYFDSRIRILLSNSAILKILVNSSWIFNGLGDEKFAMETPNKSTR